MHYFSLNTDPHAGSDFAADQVRFDQLEVGDDHWRRGQLHHQDDAHGQVGTKKNCIITYSKRLIFINFRFPNIKYVREAYGLNECGIVTLTYPREKKNSVDSK